MLAIGGGGLVFVWYFELRIIILKLLGCVTLGKQVLAGWGNVMSGCAVPLNLVVMLVGYFVVICPKISENCGIFN